MRFSRSRSHSLPHSLVLSLPRSLDLSLPLSLPSHSPLSLPLSLVLSLVLSLCLACNGGQAPCDDDTSCPDTTAGGSQSSDASVTSDPGCGGACTGASETADTWTGGGLPPDLPSDLPSDPPPPAGVAWDFEAEPLGGAAIDAPLAEGGDVQGTIAWVSGQREAAIAARGRDGVVELVDAHAVDFGEDDSFRVDLTLRTARHGQGGEAGAGVVVSRGAPEDRGFSLRVRDGALVFSVWTEGQVSEVVSSALISDDRWHQVSAARDRALGELALVVDGFDVARAPDTSGALASDAPLWLLGVGDEGRLWGALDDLAVRPGAIEAPEPTPEWDDREVFAAGVDAAEGFSYAGFRIPAIVRVASGALVAFAEGRVDDTCDFGRIHVVSKRSVDGGDSWSPMQIVATVGDGKAGNPIPIADGERVALMVLETPCEQGSGCECKGAQRHALYLSDDGGQSWSAREEITYDVTVDGWGGVLLGPGSGIRLERGPDAGALVVPAKHGGSAHLLVSHDHGATWSIGAEESSSPLAVNESTAAELSDGRLLVNARYQRTLAQEEMEQTLGFRQVGRVDTDWTYSDAPTFARTSQFRGPVVHGALLYRAGGPRHGDEPRVLFSFPSGQYGTSAGRRHDIRVHTSRDDGETWSRPRRMIGGWAAYSDLVTLADGRVGMLYEGGHVLGPSLSAYRRLHLLRARPEWIDHASLVTYTFEQLAPGQEVTSLAGAGGLPLALKTTGTVTTVAGEHHSTALHLGGSAYACTGPTGGAVDFERRDSFAIEVTFRTTAHADGGAIGSGTLVSKTAVNTQPSWWLRVEDGSLRFLMSQCPGQQLNCGLVTGACDALTGCENAGVSGGPSVVDGAWHHARVWRDAEGERLVLEVDGELVAESPAATLGIVTNEQPLCVGAFAGGSRVFTGDIEGIRIALP